MIERAISAARRRLCFVRFADALVLALPAALSAAAALSIVPVLLGRPAPGLVAVGAAAAVAVLSAAAALLVRPVTRAFAAAEADRALGLDERISTAFALRRGLVEDPLGFGDALVEDAECAARRADLTRLARALPRRRALPCLASLPLAAVVLVLAAVRPTTGGPPAGGPSAEAARAAVTALRRLEQRAAAAEAAAIARSLPEASALAARLRDEAARLAAERPRPSEALARLDSLERSARDVARRFAGLPPPDDSISESEDLARFAALAEALRAIEAADPASLRPRITALIDRLRDPGSGEFDAAEESEAAALAEALRALEALGAAMADLEVSGAASSLSGGLDPHDLARLAEAAAAIRRLMEERGLSAEERAGRAAEARKYRLFQATDEEIEAMIRALEELRRMLEMGEDVASARAEAGGLPGGLGGGPGGLEGAGGGRFLIPVAGHGPGTGGSGTGRGGRPPVRADTTPARPDFIPGSPGPEGTATLIRTVRRLPAPEAPPEERLDLRRAATREAEEALRRGEVPRRRQGVVRRFFADPEDGR
jgi:hypothetical protein